MLSGMVHGLGRLPGNKQDEETIWAKKASEWMKVRLLSTDAYKPATAYTVHVSTGLEKIRRTRKSWQRRQWEWTEISGFQLLALLPTTCSIQLNRAHEYLRAGRLAKKAEEWIETSRF